MKSPYAFAKQSAISSHAVARKPRPLEHGFIIQGFGNAGLEFGDFVVVVLFGGEVEGHGGVFLMLLPVKGRIQLGLLRCSPGFMTNEATCYQSLRNGGPERL